MGLVASSPTGFELLSEFNGFVEFLTQQVVSCETLSMRGTCFYILGLISLTQPGRDQLLYSSSFHIIRLLTPRTGCCRTLGWESPVNTSIGISLPTDVSLLFNVSSTSVDRAKAASRRVPEESKAAMQHETPMVILRHISSLVNTITQKASYAALQKYIIPLLILIDIISEWSEGYALATRTCFGHHLSSEPHSSCSAATPSSFRSEDSCCSSCSAMLSWKVQRSRKLNPHPLIPHTGSECFETALDNSCYSPAELCARVFDDVERQQRSKVPETIECRKQPTKPFLPTQT